MTHADIGVFGGSGFYTFLDDVEEHAVTTPYGDPSAAVTIGTLGDVRVAFIPRHGQHHEFPPHRVNYRANVAAMRELGVRALLAPFAAGSLQPTIHPGRLRGGRPVRRSHLGSRPTRSTTRSMTDRPTCRSPTRMTNTCATSW